MEIACYGASIVPANNQHGVTGNTKRESVATGTSSTRRSSTKLALRNASERSCETGTRRQALFVDIEIPHSTWRVVREWKIRTALSTLLGRVRSCRRHTDPRPAYIFSAKPGGSSEVVCGGGEFGRSSLHFAHVRAPRFRHGAPLICACLPLRSSSFAPHKHLTTP